MFEYFPGDFLVDLNQDKNNIIYDIIYFKLCIWLYVCLDEFIDIYLSYMEQL